MTKQNILFALDITHPGGAPIRPGASWESRDDLLQCWEGAADDCPSMADLEFALDEHHAAMANWQAEVASKAQKKGQLFLDLKTRLSADLGIDITSPDDLAGRIEDVIPAARARRASKASTAERLAEMEKQVELLTMFVVLLSRQ